MKTLLSAGVLFVLLAVVTPVCAGGIDGVWVILGPDGSLFAYAMTRENSGTLVVAVMEPDMSGWSAFWGMFDGTTSRMTTLVAQDTQIEFTLKLISPASATVTLTSCQSVVTDGCNDFMTGAVLNAIKGF